MPVDIASLDFSGFAAEDVDRLIQQFKTKAKFALLIGILSNRYKNLAEVAKSLYTQRTLDDAIDAQLDGIAEIVNLERNDGESDEDLRLRIRVEIAVLCSQGERFDIQTILDLLGYPDTIVVRRTGTATFEVVLTDNVVSDEQIPLVVNALKAAKPVGVGMYAYFNSIEEELTFTLDASEDDEAGFDEGAFVGEFARRASRQPFQVSRVAALTIENDFFVPVSIVIPVVGSVGALTGTIIEFDSSDITLEDVSLAGNVLTIDPHSFPGSFDIRIRIADEGGHVGTTRLITVTYTLPPT